LQPLIVLLIIHPDSEQQASAPLGASCNKHSFVRFLWLEIKQGNTNQSIALQAQIIVINYPFLAKAITPTCFLPLIEFTRSGLLALVLTPIPFML